MREIKFRAWDKNREEMNITVSGLTGIDNPNNDDPLKYVCGNKNVIDWKDCELMQYTGLKDKNGKDVYQGDILKITADKEGYGSVSYEGFAEITSQTCGYGFRVFNPTEEEMDRKGISNDSSSLWHIGDDTGKWIEIIGNIYENPELLK